jgi:hypothetical protein
VQTALEAILEVPLHKKDWGGEINDLYTANVIVGGRRRASAFLLKGKDSARRRWSPRLRQERRSACSSRFIGADGFSCSVPR